MQIVHDFLKNRAYRTELNKQCKQFNSQIIADEDEATIRELAKYITIRDYIYGIVYKYAWSYCLNRCAINPDKILLAKNSFFYEDLVISNFITGNKAAIVAMFLRAITVQNIIINDDIHKFIRKYRTNYRIDFIIYILYCDLTYKFLNEREKENYILLFQDKCCQMTWYDFEIFFKPPSTFYNQFATVFNENEQKALITYVELQKNAITRFYTTDWF